VAKLVFSYSHLDENLRDALEVHLTSLKRQGLIEMWHDRRILAGEEFEGKIDQYFEEADVILLLVSPDFIASDYCFNIEMQRAIERHHEGSARVIPVILRPCDWHPFPFGKLLAATEDGKAITKFPTLDDGFYQVVLAVKAAIKDMKMEVQVQDSVGSAQKTTSTGAVKTQMASKRSANLRVRKEFSDKDRDEARRSCFEFVANYFESSLAELKKRNNGIDVAFRRIDANGFEATIYVNGKQKGHCGIFMAGSDRWGGSDLAFSFGGVTKGSFNESVSVQDDGYNLGFKALGMATYGAAKEGLLTEEGVAESFWELLIRPLQS
jgi:hypothetical protein